MPCNVTKFLLLTHQLLPVRTDPLTLTINVPTLKNPQTTIYREKQAKNSPQITI